MSKETNTLPAFQVPEIGEQTTRVVPEHERVLIDQAPYSGGSVPPVMVEHLPPTQRKPKKS